MAHKFVLDTHALVWYLEGNKRLSRKARNTMEALENELVLPILAPAEAVLMIERGRSSISSVSEFMGDVYAESRIEIYPLTLEIFQRSLNRDASKIPELHDRLIVSTGLYLRDTDHTVSILTADTAITDADVIQIHW